MFDKEKAAKYFVVAWVKNWNMWTYLTAIGAFNNDFELIHDIYPWMPSKDEMFFLYKNQDIRAWAARSMKPISDKLWDTEDNLKKLSLAKHIEAWISDKTSASTQHKKDVNERNKDLRKNMQSGFEHKVSVQTMRNGYKTNWNVCK